MPTPQNVTTAWNICSPKCGDDDQIDIAATVHIRLCVDGTDVTAASNGDHQWNQDSMAVCGNCDFTGKVSDFSTEAA